MTIKNWSVANKLTFLNIIVFLSGVIGIFGAFQINKGASLHELNIQHLSHIQSFINGMNDFKSNKLINLSPLEQQIRDIRKEPETCLKKLNWIDGVVMKLAGTDQAISVCKNDLKIADKALGAINEYKNSSVSQNALKGHLDDAVSGFQKSSEDFQPLVAKTVRFAFIGTIVIFISKALLLIAGGQLISISIAGDYIKLKQALSEKEFAEREIEKHRQHLEELVEERTRELELSNAQLLHSEKLSAIGKLTASFAHEFNNPLYGVQNVLEEIKEDVPMKDSEKHLVDIALSESRRMASLIEKLKSFNRPTTNEFAVHDIHKIINDMALLQKKSFLNSNINLSLNFGKNIPDLSVIPDQLKQVILNILQNSQDAMGETGGSIEISTRSNKDNVEICVEDSGTGISEDNKTKIFEPFFTTKPGIKGTGLGLSVSHGIIKSHGGSISVDSKPGLGTKIIITLPINNNYLHQSNA